MTKERLASSLRPYLAVPITTEEQVLYVLVATRKLLELANYPRDKYRSVKFMCDWTVHTAIDRNSWSRESLMFLDGILGENKSWEELDDDEKRRLLDIVGLEGIRTELMHILRSAGVPPIALGHAGGWCAFLQALVALVRDCPLKLTGGSYLDEVNVQLTPSPLGKNIFDLSWIFQRLDKAPSFALALTIYVEQSDFHFGRGGKAIDDAFDARLSELGYDFKRA